jgi:hypothetical protein
MKILSILLLFCTSNLLAQGFSIGARASYVIPSYSSSYGRVYLEAKKHYVFGLVSSQKLTDKVYIHEEVLFQHLSLAFISRSSPLSYQKVPNLTVPFFIEYKITERFGIEGGIEYNHFTQENISLNGSTNAYSLNLLLGSRFKLAKNFALDCRLLSIPHYVFLGKNVTLELSLLAFLSTKSKIER